MSRWNRILPAAAIALVAAAAGPAVAGFSPGGAFRVPGYGARAWGMAGAAVATVDDEGAVYWNPGMMALANRPHAGASYVNLVAGATARLSQVAYVRVLSRFEPEADGRVVGRHAAGAMYTNLHLGFQDGDGYDENTLRLAYAYSPDHLVTFAIAWDVFASSSGVPGFDARGTSVDGAIRLALSENFTLGAVARNAFSRYSYRDGSDHRRERAFVFGLSSRSLGRVAIEGDMEWSHGGASRWILGAETDYFFGVLALRAGLAAFASGESRTVPYFGFAAGARNLAIHYNANLDADDALGQTHRFGVSVTL